jgi:hypothetical protein
MNVHKRYFVKSCAGGKASVIDIFIGLPVVSDGRPMVALPYEEASAVADLFNAMDEARFGKAHSPSR